MCNYLYTKFQCGHREKSMLPDDPRDCPMALARSRTDPLGVPFHCRNAQKLEQDCAQGPCNREHDNTECRRAVRRASGWVCHRCSARMGDVDVCTECMHDECEDCTQAMA